MRFSAANLAALALLSSLCPGALPRSIDNAPAYTRRQVAARDRLFASLTDDVRQDLQRRDPREYDLNLDLFMQPDSEADFAQDELDKRDFTDSPGARRCANGDTAITYHDGPFTYNRQLSDIWADAGHAVTYFINVNSFACAYDAPNVENLQHAMQRGHIVASHTGTHPHIERLTLAALDAQIEMVERYTYRTLGVVPATFRPPYGETNATINRHLRRKWGLRTVMWSVHSGDNEGKTPEESVALITQTKKGGGDIIIKHEIQQTSATKVAPRIVEYFKTQGIKSRGIDKCLGVKPYKVKLHRKPRRNPSWTCNGMLKHGEA